MGSITPPAPPIGPRGARAEAARPSVKRSPFAVLAGVVSFLVVGYATRLTIDWIRREPAVSTDIAKRPWVEQALAPGSVSIDVPWPLERQESPLPPQVAKLVTRSVTLMHEADGLHVMAAVTSFAPGTPANLDGAADGALANMKTVQGTRSVNGNKRESSVLGLRAIELEARIERERGVPLQLRGVIFVRGDDLLQVLLISRSDQPLGAAAWERLRASIRTPGTRNGNTRYQVDLIQGGAA